MKPDTESLMAAGLTRGRGIVELTVTCALSAHIRRVPASSLQDYEASSPSNQMINSGSGGPAF